MRSRWVSIEFPVIIPLIDRSLILYKRIAEISRLPCLYCSLVSKDYVCCASNILMLKQLENTKQNTTVLTFAWVHFSIACIASLYVHKCEEMFPCRVQLRRNTLLILTKYIFVVLFFFFDIYFLFFCCGKLYNALHALQFLKLYNSKILYLHRTYLSRSEIWI